MTHRERIEMLRELKERPMSTIEEKFKLVEESLNWAIKICNKHISRKEAKNDQNY